jgi:drug/metabolite transporter (DMT)-like permease
MAKSIRLFRMVVTALLVTFLWGSVAPVIKLGYQELDIQANQIGKQLLFAGHITLLASCVLFLFIRLKKQSIRIKGNTALSILKVSIFQVFLNYFFFFIGVSLSSGSVGSIMAGTTSLFQLLFAHFIFKNERLTWTKNIGLLIGLFGIMMLNMTTSFRLSIEWGDILLLASVFAGAWGNLLAAKMMADVDTKIMTGYAMLVSSIGFFVIGYGMVGSYSFVFTFHAVLLLFYLGGMSATALLLWNDLMRCYPVGRVSLFLFLIPVFGVIISSVLLNEPIKSNTFLALAFVIIGIIVVNRKKNDRKKGSRRWVLFIFTK